MKSKLSAALVAAACVLAVSPANALTVTLTFPATMTSVPGAVLFDDFDSVQNTAIGIITGGSINQGGPPPATGNFIGAGTLAAIANVTVTFTNPVSYVGFAWGTPDSPNQVDVYDGSTLLGSFFGNAIFNPTTYYFDIHAGPGEQITRLVLSDPGTCCFETDNYTAIVATPIPAVGLPGLALILAGGGLLGWWRRRQKSGRTT